MKYVFKNRRNILLASIFDFFGYGIFFFLRRRTRPVPARQILVVRLDHIGDFVCTTPLFKNIKKHYPASRITALVNPASADLAACDPSIDAVLTLDPFWFKGRRSSASWREFFNLIGIMRTKRFDIGFDVRGDFFSILLMFLGGVRYRVGYGATGAVFLLHIESRYEKDKHAIERNLDVLRAADIPVTEKNCQIAYRDSDCEIVEAILHNAGYSGNKALVLHPFAGTAAKQWPAEKFAQLIQKLQSGGWNIFVVGTRGDPGAYRGCFDMRGILSLPQLAYLIGRIGFFIGLDSGPANIAAALGVRTIVIASGVNQANQWLPDRGNIVFIEHAVPCKPCEDIVCPKEKHYCMEAVTVEAVMRMIDEHKP